MDTRMAIALRLQSLCFSKNITINKLANISGVSSSTLKSILYGKSKNPGTVTIKKLCDGLNMTLGEFFSTKEFDNLEQEIK